MQERRHFVRLDTRVKIEYKIVESPLSKLNSFTKNISEGGICLFLDSFVQKGTLLDLKLFLPEEPELIQATGKIVWIDRYKLGDASAQEHYEAGIEFMDIADTDQKRIGKYVFGTLNTNP